ncbi:acetyltransferase [Naegleria gruberi]|uniref:Acetyltransferase n=1 Tax=Naegleria gruberi TaxID=5762 RepID=D2V8B3_NAEGR|nr:acetyltransferase [Naegleria gruberi]EFC47149.1 acetyltransferase [Naegleria gruberi]|eukprot:XP_002679893.1 acetyltransferase [Naegleria gruberi strain NEG-M]
MFIDGSNSRYLIGDERTVLTSGIWYKNQLAGVIAVQNFDKSNCNCEIGYWIGEEFQGKGIATRSVQCFCKELFQKLDNSPIKSPLNKITFRVAEDNLKSIKICERIGCVKEGLLRQDEFYHGKFHNVLLYSILKSEMN